MKNMKFICVTQRLVFDEKTKSFKDALDKELINFLNKIGYYPIPIPNLKLNTEKIYKLLNFYKKKLKVRGFIFSGGEDLNKNKERYKIEKAIYNFCSKNKIPLFGICRGLQMIAHLNRIKLSRVRNHVAKRHIIISKNIKKKYKRHVNSYHNIQIDACPKGYNITHVSHDNVIEGIKHDKLPITAVMWHPEREKKYNRRDINKFKNIFK